MPKLLYINNALGIILSSFLVCLYDKSLLNMKGDLSSDYSAGLLCIVVYECPSVIITVETIQL